MSNELPEGRHQRPNDYPNLCCLGMLYSCGHSAMCMYDEEWEAAHDRLHRWDALPEMFFWISVILAIAVWRLTS